MKEQKLCSVLPKRLIRLTPVNTCLNNLPLSEFQLRLQHGLIYISGRYTNRKSQRLWSKAIQGLWKKNTCHHGNENSHSVGLRWCIDGLLNFILLWCQLHKKFKLTYRHMHMHPYDISRTYSGLSFPPPKGEVRGSSKAYNGYIQRFVCVLWMPLILSFF